MSAARVLTAPAPRLARLPAPEPNRDVPRWRPIARLGHGGMGVVWEVEHAELGRRAALKVLAEHHRGRIDLAARLRDEARAMARLSHPGVPGVLDLGELDDGRPFFVMELVRGQTLRAEVARHGVLSVPAAARWVGELLDALGAVHRAGLVHRDVKLDNVLIDDRGRAVLVDFGVALDLDAPLRRTGRGHVVGTPRTMSPEQHAHADVDPRADLYAAGLCLFELVAGRGPFEDAERSAEGLLHAHCRRPPPRLTDVAPQLVQQAVEEVVARALAKSPEDRFSSASAMREALRRAAHASVPSQRPSSPGAWVTQISPSPRRGPAQVELAAASTSSPTWVLSASELEELDREIEL